MIDQCFFNKINELYNTELNKPYYHNIKVLCEIVSQTTQKNLLDTFLNIYNYKYDEYI